MIDDGTVEKAGIKMAGQSYVICKFHLVRAWTKRLNLHHQKLTKSEIKDLMKLLYRLYNSKTEQIYSDVYKEFITKAPTKFIEYFNKTWHDKEFYKSWTCINRDSDFGDWVTNNCTEATFRKIQQMIGKHSRRLSVFLKDITKVLLAEVYSIRLVKLTSKTEDDAKSRFTKGKKLGATPSDTDTVFYVNSSKNKEKSYECDLFSSECTCYDYLYNCRPCKHLYSAMINFLQFKGIKLPDECTCFHYIEAVYLFIHYPDEFKIWNFELKRAYPTKNDSKKKGRPTLNKNKKKKRNLQKKVKSEVKKKKKKKNTKSRVWKEFVLHPENQRFL
jgi:hypothetical protein